VSFPVFDNTHQYRSDQQRNVPFVRTVGAGACNCVTRRCPTTPATRCSAPKQRSCLLQSVEQSSVVWKVCSIMGWRRRRTTTHHGLGCGSSQIIVVDDTGERRWVQTTFVRLFRHLHRYHRYRCDAVGGGGLDWSFFLCIDLLWRGTTGQHGRASIRATGLS
jgi:hypothetical protein